jgi:phage recombination protein Bet
MNEQASPNTSITLYMASKFGMAPGPFEATVRATCMPADKNGRVPSREEFAAFLLVAKQYNLNPLTREIYAFTNQRGGGIVPVVSIDGWMQLINSHPQFDGMEFHDDHDADGKLNSTTCIIHRKDRSHPTVITEYLAECYRDTAAWKMPHRMLRHKAAIQCARYAFSFSGIVDPDEAERIAIATSNQAPRQLATPPNRVPPPPPQRTTFEPAPPKPEPQAIKPRSAEPYAAPIQAKAPTITPTGVVEDGLPDYETARKSFIESCKIAQSADAIDEAFDFTINPIWDKLVTPDQEDALNLLNEAKERFPQ